MGMSGKNDRRCLQDSSSTVVQTFVEVDELENVRRHGRLPIHPALISQVISLPYLPKILSAKKGFREGFKVKLLDKI
jgi:hypothetical protein